jgi:xanthine dehydrogenase accessory factor
MLVSSRSCQGTVGGGHLELRAIEIARGMLGKGRQRHLERFALGPSLGQCCGGVVHLAFELADPGHLALLQERRLQDTWRITSLDLKARALVDEQGRHLVGHATPIIDRARGTHLMKSPDGSRWLVDPIRAPRARLLLFGAGHVGAALVKALADLPCSVTWIDEREEQFPGQVPANTTIEASDTPEALVAQAPPGASYLVMTHSHALDQRLAEAVLGRLDVGWFGLIGSRTKRKQFEHRLRERGVDGERVAAMVCPIGLPGIRSKAPAVIAASVCAQLLMVWEAQATLQQGF